MECDYFFDKDGRFEIEFEFEMTNGKFVKRPIIIEGKPFGKIYMDITKGTGRGIYA